MNTNLQCSIRNLQNICRNIWNLQNICKNGLRNQNQQQNISMAVKSMREQVNYLNKSVFFGPCFLPSTNVLWSQLKTEFTLVFGLPLLPFWKITQVFSTDWGNNVLSRRFERCCRLQAIYSHIKGDLWQMAVVLYLQFHFWRSSHYNMI